MQFIIHNTTDGYYVQGTLNQAEGIYYVTGHTDKEAEATKFSPMSGNENHGKVIVKGLEDDTYVITEVQTDAGYKAPEGEHHRGNQLPGGERDLPHM